LNTIVQSVGGIFSSGEFPAITEPDNAPQRHGKPASDFVLCRDEAGKATAVYGDALWDFNPYRLSAKKITKINFDTVFDYKGAEQEALIEEVKYLLYCLIYFAGDGRVGKLSVTTLIQYWWVLRITMRFCLEQKQKPLVGALSLQEIFTIPVYLAAFIREKSFSHKVLSGVLQGLVRVGEVRLGYPVVDSKKFDLKKLSNCNQHPVIPTRIYLNIINLAGDLLDDIYEGAEYIEDFIACFADENYGVAHKHQKARGLAGKKNLRPDIALALESHGLTSIFSGEFSCSQKRKLQGALLKMQYVVKTIIHIYTGMRDQEVMRMPYNCLSDQIVRQAVVDDQGVERDKPLIVNVLSTTTKFSGYKKEGAWFAPGEVVKAVEVAQAICRGLAKLYQVELDDRCPLFLNPSIVGYTRRRAEVGVPRFLAKKMEFRDVQTLLIQTDDLQELAQSDPTRDFHSDPDYAVGQAWPLTSHQFRRSLAFYGSSSGFVSLPSLRTQYKHMTIEMSRYYANHYGNLRTIFGYFDEKKKEFVLPSNHFAFEYQMALPMTVANQLIADLLLSEEPLFGGTGYYMEKQKRRVKAGEVRIEEVRTDTEIRVKSGAISYRPTLLGGCTKSGRCDSYMLGDFTECLSCEGAIIKLANLNAAIEDATTELCNYAEGSGEYQIVKHDIERLTAFKARMIDMVDLQ